MILAETHANANKNSGHFRGRGRRQRRDFRRGGGRSDPITDRTHKNKTITWLQIMILTRSQLGNRMIFVINMT